MKVKIISLKHDTITLEGSEEAIAEAIAYVMSPEYREEWFWKKWEEINSK